MIDVSVIIVSWNTRDLLRQCLHSVYRESTGIGIEVIVIDNASTDGSADMVLREFPQVVLVRNSDNRGFAAANNQGLAIAQGRHVLLLNPDTVVLERAIQKSIAFAEKHHTAGVVGVRNNDAEGRLTKNCFLFASVFNLMISTLGMHRAFPNNRVCGRERLSWWNYLDDRRVDVVAGCYMLVRREALEDVGGLDESYFMYGEEMDWCWRFKRAGWEVWYHCDAAIIHYGGMSAAQNPVAMQKHAQRSYLQFIQKRQGRLARAIASALIVASGALRVAYWGCRWAGASGAARESSARRLRQSVTAAMGR